MITTLAIAGMAGWWNFGGRVRYRAGQDGFCPRRPHRYTGPGGEFCPLIPPRPRFLPPKIDGALSGQWAGRGLGRGWDGEGGKRRPALGW